MPDFDVVIIGSGPGGATAADVLTAAGKSVCVLEKGRNHLLALEPPFDNLGHLSNDEIKFDRRHFLGPDPLLEPRTYRRSAADGDRTFTGDVNNMPSTVGGAGYHADGKLPRYREIDFRLASELGPVDGADVADWPVDYDEMEPYYAEAERSIGVAGDHTANPFAAWRADPYPMPPGADMFLTTLTASRGRAARLSPVPRADGRQQRRRTTAGPRATTAASARSTGARSKRRATRWRCSDARCAPATARSGPRASRSRCSSTAPGSRAGECATSTPTASQHEVSVRRGRRRVRRVRDAAAPAAQRHRELVRSRRPLPDVPPADARARLLPDPTPCVQGSLRHASHGRSDHRRRRECGGGEGGRRAVHARRHRRARRQRPHDHRGAVHAARAGAQRAHGAVGPSRPDGRLHDAGRGPAAADEPRRPRPCRPRRVGSAGRTDHLHVASQSTSRARSTGARGSRRSSPKRARTPRTG